ncbi:Conserved_hypothetical protein [Hexamita inflata]|uniref:Uncharacterized protein n=1 Tax=Hexamita inflata TaxID=28002 RepID=A0AA86R983_9EUKA|nr:Conserved hypothetical protein [Hexamita inflata]
MTQSETIQNTLQTLFQPYENSVDLMQKAIKSINSFTQEEFLDTLNQLLKILLSNEIKHQKLQIQWAIVQICVKILIQMQIEENKVSGILATIIEIRKFQRQDELELELMIMVQILKSFTNIKHYFSDFQSGLNQLVNTDKYTQIVVAHKISLMQFEMDELRMEQLIKFCIKNKIPWIILTQIQVDILDLSSLHESFLLEIFIQAKEQIRLRTNWRITYRIAQICTLIIQKSDNEQLVKQAYDLILITIIEETDNHLKALLCFQNEFDSVQMRESWQRNQNYYQNQIKLLNSEEQAVLSKKLQALNKFDIKPSFDLEPSSTLINTQQKSLTSPTRVTLWPKPRKITAEEAKLVKLYNNKISGKSLVFEDNKLISSIKFIDQYQITALTVKNCDNFIVSSVPLNISQLKVELCRIRDFSSVQQLSLQQLSLCATLLSDLSLLQNLSQLQELSLNSNQISDIRPITALKSLISVQLNFNFIKDFTPLRGLPNLKNVQVKGNLAKILEVQFMFEMDLDICATDYFMWNNNITKDKVRIGYM